VNGKPKARRYSFDAETEAVLERGARANRQSVPEFVRDILVDALQRETRDIADLYAVSKAGPQIGLDES